MISFGETETGSMVVCSPGLEHAPIEPFSLDFSATSWMLYTGPSFQPRPTRGSVHKNGGNSHQCLAEGGLGFVNPPLHADGTAVVPYYIFGGTHKPYLNMEGNTVNCSRRRTTVQAIGQPLYPTPYLVVPTVFEKQKTVHRSKPKKNYYTSCWSVHSRVENTFYWMTSESESNKRESFSSNVLHDYVKASTAVCVCAAEHSLTHVFSLSALSEMILHTLCLSKRPTQLPPHNTRIASSRARSQRVKMLMLS